jgi:cobalt-zinc-cadmium efflux system protein
MIGVAFLALVLNGAIAFHLKRGTHDLNTRSAYIHMLGDALAAIGVILAGIVILFTGAVWVDQLVSVVIGIFILWTSWSVIRESVDVLLESAPAHLDMKLVEDTVKGVAGVITIHDLHVWTISSNMLACSCHVVVSKHTVEEGQQVIKNIVKELETRFHIGHTTIQIEIEGCDPNDMYCSIGRGGH